MRPSPRTLLSTTAFLVLLVTISSAAFGHGGQIDVGSGPKGPVILSAAQISALDLKTAQAQMRPVAHLLSVTGEVQPLASAQAVVSLRISGTVQAIYVNPGVSVKRGQKLALVQSRVVGNPPPVVAVTAPIGGIVDTRDVTLGQGVEPGTALFHLSDRSSMRVVGKVYEEDLGQVHTGQKAFVKLLAYPKQLLSGTVNYVGPTLDPDTRTVEVWILLDNAQGLLKPNLFARADIVLSENPTALVVPNSAVLEAGGENFVFVRDGAKFNRVDVTVGVTDDEVSEILSGLVPGDEVVTQGAREVYTTWLTGGHAPAADND
ncbi:MAG: efflux RND transporter periplasmic adaptor subunit [Proteobacteria bacterium]|nr:efflux RND transporter periplasmic adaptor subunit [Pseudomonadota bacterium]